MMILGLTFSLVMGIVLATIGGGGSILTVPILVYVLGVSAHSATAYSLFIVGVSSLVAALDYQKRGLIEYKTGVTFALPALFGVYSTRRFLMPAIPDEILRVLDYTLTKDGMILLVFSIVMILAALSMIRGNTQETGQEKKTPSLLLVFIEGIAVGGLTGFVGAGGGFLIIPVLVILVGLEMKMAVGTSLFIISIKSLFGFIGDIQSDLSMDYKLLLLVSSASLLGILIGSQLSRQVDSKRLKPVFGWFVLIIGTAMVTKEIL